MKEAKGEGEGKGGRRELGDDIMVAGWKWQAL